VGRKALTWPIDQLQIYCRVRWFKDFETQLAFGEVMGNIIVAPLLALGSLAVPWFYSVLHHRHSGSGVQ